MHSCFPNLTKRKVNPWPYSFHLSQSLAASRQPQIDQPASLRNCLSQMADTPWLFPLWRSSCLPYHLSLHFTDTDFTSVSKSRPFSPDIITSNKPRLEQENVSKTLCWNLIPWNPGCCLTLLVVLAAVQSANSPCLQFWHEIITYLII